jgi:hypothetical protein
MKPQLRTCPLCRGHGQLPLRAGGRQVCGADGRQLFIHCADCGGSGLIPACQPTPFADGVRSYTKALRDLEMVVTEAGTYVLAPEGGR